MCAAPFRLVVQRVAAGSGGFDPGVKSRKAKRSGPVEGPELSTTGYTPDAAGGADFFCRLSLFFPASFVLTPDASWETMLLDKAASFRHKKHAKRKKACPAGRCRAPLFATVADGQVAMSPIIFAPLRAIVEARLRRDALPDGLKGKHRDDGTQDSVQELANIDLDMIQADRPAILFILPYNSYLGAEIRVRIVARAAYGYGGDALPPSAPLYLPAANPAGLALGHPPDGSGSQTLLEDSSRVVAYYVARLSQPRLRRHPSWLFHRGGEACCWPDTAPFQATLPRILLSLSRLASQPIGHRILVPLLIGNTRPAARDSAGLLQDIEQGLLCGPAGPLTNDCDYNDGIIAKEGPPSLKRGREDAEEAKTLAGDASKHMETFMVQPWSVLPLECALTLIIQSHCIILYRNELENMTTWYYNKPTSINSRTTINTSTTDNITNISDGPSSDSGDADAYPAPGSPDETYAIISPDLSFCLTGAFRKGGREADRRTSGNSSHDQEGASLSNDVSASTADREFTVLRPLPDAKAYPLSRIVRLLLLLLLPSQLVISCASPWLPLQCPEEGECLMSTAFAQLLKAGLDGEYEPGGRALGSKDEVTVPLAIQYQYADTVALNDDDIALGMCSSSVDKDTRDAIVYHFMNNSKIER